MRVEKIQINQEKNKIDLIKESICVYKKCMECRNLYKNKALCFSHIEDFVDDRGRSCLFRLKEMCHTLYRKSDDATYKEKLYDMTVGYIFHEAMKLRENLYQLEYYRPNYTKELDQLTAVEKKIINEINTLTKKAEKRLKEGFKEIKKLLKELVAQLMDLIKLYKDSYLMPRFILENQKDLIMIFGRKGYERLINELYRDGREMLMLKAAISYIESEYYDLSKGLLKKVLLMNKNNEVAKFLLFYCLAHFYYFKNKLHRALNFAKNALSINIVSQENDLKAYREKLDELIKEIQKELKKKTIP